MTLPTVTREDLITLVESFESRSDSDIATTQRLGAEQPTLFHYLNCAIDGEGQRDARKIVETAIHVYRLLEIAAERERKMELARMN